MGLYRRKPVLVEAIRWTGKEEDISEILRLFDNVEGFEFVKRFRYIPENGALVIPTIEDGEITVQSGDWVIQDVKNKVYPYKPDVFEETYDEIVDFEWTPPDGC